MKAKLMIRDFAGSYRATVFNGEVAGARRMLAQSLRFERKHARPVWLRRRLDGSRSYSLPYSLQCIDLTVKGVQL